MANVDWGFIKKHELTVASGYTIPGRTGDRSGVTVASGFDLGQHSWKQIKDWPISQELKEKLRPFLGLTGTAARNLQYITPPNDAFDPGVPIARQIVPPKTVKVSAGDKTAIVKMPVAGGLDLTEAEVAAIDKVVRDRKLARIRENYDNGTGPKPRAHFDALPGTIQTAIVSFCFQYGENVCQKPADDRRRRYWNALVAQDWSAAMDTLLKLFFTDKDRAFAARRWDEITLLRYGMGDGPLGPELKQRLLNESPNRRVS